MLTTPNTPLLLPLYSHKSLRKKNILNCVITNEHFSKGRTDFLLVILQSFKIIPGTDFTIQSFIQRLSEFWTGTNCIKASLF